MIDKPLPINLATDAELKSMGWTDVARDDDDHAVGVIYRHGCTEDVFREWLTEQVDAGLYVKHLA